MRVRPYIVALLVITTLTICIALLSCTANQAYTTKNFSTRADIKPVQYKASRHIQKAYAASLSLMMNVNNKSKVVGSGVILRNRAHQPIIVLTALHVIEAIQSRQGPGTLIRVGLAREKQETLTWVLAKDVQADIALLMGVSVQSSNGPEARLASTIPKIGEHVWIIGAHKGQERTVSECCLSHVFMTGNIQWYKSCANIYYGNSGGGMFNDREEIIGIIHGHYLTHKLLKIVVPGSGHATALPHLRELIKKALP